MELLAAAFLELPVDSAVLLEQRVAAPPQLVASPVLVVAARPQLLTFSEPLVAALLCLEAFLERLAAAPPIGLTEVGQVLVLVSPSVGALLHLAVLLEVFLGLGLEEAQLEVEQGMQVQHHFQQI